MMNNSMIQSDSILKATNCLAAVGKINSPSSNSDVSCATCGPVPPSESCLCLIPLNFQLSNVPVACLASSSKPPSPPILNS